MAFFLKLPGKVRRKTFKSHEEEFHPLSVAIRPH